MFADRKRATRAALNSCYLDKIRRLRTKCIEEGGLESLAYFDQICTCLGLRKSRLMMVRTVCEGVDVRVRPFLWVTSRYSRKEGARGKCKMAHAEWVPSLPVLSGLLKASISRYDHLLQGILNPSFNASPYFP